VFNGAVAILDEAMALIDAMPEEGNVDLSGGDLIYRGNMNLWRRYANTLKLRILMMLRNQQNVSSQISEALSNDLIETNAQSALIRYVNDPGGQNGYNRLVEAFFGVSNEAQGVYAPSPTLYELLQGDPRFDIIIKDNDNDPCLMNQFAFDFNCPTISDNVIRDNLPHMLAMPAEVSLYKAELAMADGDMSTASSEYRKGVSQNIAWWGGDIPGSTGSISSDVASAFVDGLDDPTLEDIHTQLYIESFIRPVVAWNSVRRTKTPDLKAVPGSNITTILKRFNYPPDEIGANPNAPANPPTDTPMWFEN